MRLTADRKQSIVRLVDPATRAARGLFRLATLDPRGRDRALPADPAQVRAILVVRLDTIGDVLLSEPAIAALGRHFPNAAIHVLVSAAGAAVLANHPAIAAFHRYEAAWHGAWRGRPVRWSTALAGLREVVRGLRRERFDLAIELRGDIRDIGVAALAGARLTVSGPTRGGRGLVDLAVDVDPDAHRIYPPLQIVGALGVPVPDDPMPRVYPTEADRRTAGSVVPGGAPAVALHLGAGFASKCLPIPTFAAIVTGIRQAAPGTRFVVVGGAEDRPLVEALARRLPGIIDDQVGRLSLLETAAVLERCALFVGNDSAPMHLAATAGVPVVAFFGPSQPGHYGPWGNGHTVIRTDLSCSPCDHVHCVQAIPFLCMKQMRPEPAIEAALRHLGMRAAAGGVS